MSNDHKAGIVERIFVAGYEAFVTYKGPMHNAREIHDTGASALPAIRPARSSFISAQA
jgi:hypothetical protein